MFDGKISILRELFPDFRIRKGYEFVTFCPSERCRHHGNDKRKLEISLRDNRFACWRCHYSGSPLRLFKDFGTRDQRQRYASAMGLVYEASGEEKERLELPPEYKFILDCPRSIVSGHAIDWLARLGVSREVVFQNRVGLCESGNYRNRIIFPSFDISGRLNYFVTRHLYNNNEYKWLNCPASMRENIFNELFVDWNKPIVLVESVKAYLKHFEGIDNLICGNGTKISPRHKLFKEIVLNDVPKVYVAFDAEADAEAASAMNEFYEYGIETRFVKFDDDIQPDEIETDDFVSCIEAAVEFEKADLLKSKIKRLQATI